MIGQMPEGVDRSAGCRPERGPAPDAIEREHGIPGGKTRTGGGRDERRTEHSCSRTGLPPFVEIAEHYGRGFVKRIEVPADDADLITALA